MPIQEQNWIWMDGVLQDWGDCKVHVLTHALHYGSSVFEGIRCYETSKGPAVFRLKDHLVRFLASAKMYRMEIPFEVADLSEAVASTIRRNELRSCYVRPLAFRGYGEMGVNPLGCPVRVAIATWPWGAYLGDDAAENGVDVCVSSWRRFAPGTVPNLAKAGGHYLNSQLIKMEALANGYAEGIALTVQGMVAEGSGENLFLVSKDQLWTPFVGDSVLSGITRDTVMKMAAQAGLPVKEQPISREMLYAADEIFLTGTAAEITPVRSVDKIAIGSGKPGPASKQLMAAFRRMIKNGEGQEEDWFFPVPQE